MSLEVNITKKLNGFTLHANFAARSTATAILGASGCGKSMTLRCIAGIVKPDAGRIVLDGRVLFDSAQHIDLPPQQRGVGLLFQNYALFPNMTVEQNVLCGLKAEKDKAARKARCAEMLFGEKSVYRLREGGMGSEDFASYTYELPCAYLLLGAGTAQEDARYGKPMHNESVVFNENILPRGSALLAYGAMQWLEDRQ